MTPADHAVLLRKLFRAGSAWTRASLFAVSAASDLPKSLRWLLSFTSLSCLAGAAELLAFPHGNAYVPLAVLAPTPFPDFTVPGLLLAIVATTQVVALALTLRRAATALDATLLAGAALTLWIIVEMALLQIVHPLHALYGGLGALILGLALRQVARHGPPRTRWVVTVTVFEGLGYLAPAAAGIVLARTSLSASLVVLTMALAGAIEGGLLGLGQARAFPFAVPRARYAAASAAGAALVWSLVIGLQQHAERGGTWGVGSTLFALLAGAFALVAIGGAQWLVLRRVRTSAAPWIAWTALAWTLALPLSFAPGPLVDETTPLFVHIVVWPAGGLLMAYVMAWVTWQGARRFGADSRAP